MSFCIFFKVVGLKNINLPESKFHEISLSLETVLVLICLDVMCNFDRGLVLGETEIAFVLANFFVCRSEIPKYIDSY